MMTVVSITDPSAGNDTIFRSFTAAMYPMGTGTFFKLQSYPTIAAMVWAMFSTRPGSPSRLDIRNRLSCKMVKRVTARLASARTNSSTITMGGLWGIYSVISHLGINIHSQMRHPSDADLLTTLSFNVIVKILDGGNRKEVLWFYFESKVAFNDNHQINVIQPIQFKGLPQVRFRYDLTGLHLKLFHQELIYFANYFKLFHFR